MQVYLDPTTTELIIIKDNGQELRYTKGSLRRAKSIDGLAVYFSGIHNYFPTPVNGQLATDLEDQGKTPYADTDALFTALNNFFLDASAGLNVRGEIVLEAKSFVNQTPTGEGLSNAIVVNYGAGGTSSDGGIRVNPDGTIEILATGVQYQITLTLRVGRSNAVGVVDLLGWEEISLDGGSNWLQPPDSSTQVIELDDDTVAGRERAVVYLGPSNPVGFLVRILFARGENGPNQGELQAYTSADSFAGLNDDPSAEITIRRFIAS